MVTVKEEDLDTLISITSSLTPGDPAAAAPKPNNLACSCGRSATLPLISGLIIQSETLLHPSQPCLQTLLHSPLGWTVDPGIINLPHFCLKLLATSCVPLESLLSSHVLTFIPLFSRSYLIPLLIFLHLLSALMAHHSVICKHNSPGRLPSSRLTEFNPWCRLTSTFNSSDTRTVQLSNCPPTVLHCSLKYLHSHFSRCSLLPESKSSTLFLMVAKTRCLYCSQKVSLCLTNLYTSVIQLMSNGVIILTCAFTLSCIFLDFSRKASQTLTSSKLTSVSCSLLHLLTKPPSFLTNLAV